MRGDESLDRLRLELAALGLDQESRARLAKRLLESLDSPASIPVESPSPEDKVQIGAEEVKPPEDTWQGTPMMCGGDGEFGHFPSPMYFERLAMGLRGGALFRCSVCNGRKFVWRTAVMGNINWEWNARPNRKA